MKRKQHSSNNTNREIYRLYSSQRGGCDKFHEGRDGNKPEKSFRKVMNSNWFLKTRSSQTRGNGKRVWQKVWQRQMLKTLWWPYCFLNNPSAVFWITEMIYLFLQQIPTNIHEHICKRHKLRNNLQVNTKVFLEIDFQNYKIIDFKAAQRTPCELQWVPSIFSQLSMSEDFWMSFLQLTGPTVGVNKLVTDSQGTWLVLRAPNTIFLSKCSLILESYQGVSYYFSHWSQSPEDAYRATLSSFQKWIKKSAFPNFKSRSCAWNQTLPFISRLTIEQDTYLFKSRFHYLQNWNHNIYLLDYCEDYVTYLNV